MCFPVGFLCRPMVLSGAQPRGGEIWKLKGSFFAVLKSLHIKIHIILFKSICLLLIFYIKIK